MLHREKKSEYHRTLHDNYHGVIIFILLKLFFLFVGKISSHNSGFFVL